MKSVIIGTAGHIDHGKTALVKALTGIDADRLEEEKRRGITIDIGFAHLYLPAPNDETLRLGFVDVPGHERFIRNMLAGVGGIDLVLFVIAADESIKPQTREHFDICRLLEVRHGITVITKSDLVDAETLEVVIAEIKEFSHGSFLDASHTPMIPVSVLTGTGLDELKKALTQLASEIPSRDSTALPRLPIDRVFSVKGFGTVVTGTMVSGTIVPEHDLEVFPEGKHVRVRGMQVHGQSTEQAVAGERIALNLAGVAKDELKRGMMLGQSSIFRSTSTLDVELSLLPSAKPLKDRSRVHFHAYTMEAIAQVSLFGERHISPGEKRFARLRLRESTLLVPGDRFVIRQLSPATTLGGGVVLDALPLAHKISPEKIAFFLKIMAHGSPREMVVARVARREQEGLRLSDLQAEMNLTTRNAAAMVANNDQLVLTNDRVIISAIEFNRVMDGVLQAVSKFHSASPLETGIGQEELRDRVNLNPSVFNAAIEKLKSAGKLEIAGEQVRLAGRVMVMKDDEAESKKIIENAFASAGLKVPALKDVLAELKVDKARAQKIVTLLLRDKTLVKITDDLVFHGKALEILKGMIAKYKTKSPKINVTQFKDLTGVSRKYAIPLLEFLDRERITRRLGDERVIL